MWNWIEINRLSKNNLFLLLTFDNHTDELPSPLLNKPADHFERNYSGKRNRIGSQKTNGSNSSSDLKNPFLNGNSQTEEEDQTEQISTSASCYACDVSTQTDLTISKKDNCKLM